MECFLTKRHSVRNECVFLLSWRIQTQTLRRERVRSQAHAFINMNKHVVQHVFEVGPINMLGMSAIRAINQMSVLVSEQHGKQ